MISTDFNLLKPFIGEFEAVADDIVDQWVERQRVIDILAKHNLSPLFFRNHFGVKIYTYFIRVIKGDVTAGNCPIVHVMLHFFEDKMIKLHDIYTICSELKNVVVLYFIKNMHGKVDDAVFWQIVDLLDANFAGVIEEFMNERCEVIYQCTDKPCHIKKVPPREIETTNQQVICSTRLKDIRFSKQDRYDSNSLFEMLDVTVIDKIEQFIEELDELLLILYDIDEADAKEAYSLMSDVVRVLNNFYRLVNTFIAFPVMVSTFENLSSFLESLTIDTYEQNEQKTMLVLNLTGLVKDLEQWIDIVFIKKVADDVHYLDASFANNVIEIESIFCHKEIITDEKDDLEFF